MGAWKKIAFLLLYAGLLATGVWLGRPERHGDGAEYLAMALRIADLKAPAPEVQELSALQSEMSQLAGGWGVVGDFRRPLLVSHGDTQEFPHFWVYSAMAAPFIAIAEAVGLHPNYGFAALNCVLLLLAASVLLSRMPVLLAFFILLSPIVWWVDKAHTEIFTFSLLSIAFAVLADRPRLAVVLLGLAATQNPPIALVLPVAVGSALLRHPDERRNMQFWGAILVGLMLALLHPAYYLSRLGVPTPQLLGGAAVGTPSFQNLITPVLDPNLGLVIGFPAFLPALAVATSVLLFRGRIPDLAVALASPTLVAGMTAAIFLLSFTQTTNANSGATPGMTRYALWLIPLLVPILMLMIRVWSRTPRVFTGLALASWVATVLVYSPAKPEAYTAPTRLAAIIWHRAPQMDNPLIEVFWERTAHADRVPADYASIATSDCRKILVLDGKWPLSGCGAAPVLPERCAALGDACYANYQGDRYVFSQGLRR